MCGHTRALEKTGEASQRVENEKNRRTHSGSSAGSTLALQGRSSTPPSGPLASPATSASPCPSAGCRRRSSSAWRSSPPAVPLLYLTGPQSFSLAADPVGHRLPRRQQSHLRLHFWPSGLQEPLAFRVGGIMRLCWLLGVGKGAAQPVAFPAISEGLVLLLDSVHVSTC